MLRTSAFLGLFVSLSTVAAASTPELDKAVMAATHFGVKPMPAPDRKALAAAGLVYWKSFDSRIPRNSPAVLDWLHKELATTDSQRIGRAISTPEYAFWTLSETSSNCVDLFQEAVSTVGKSPLRELCIWTKTLRCYKDPGDILSYLKRTGLSNGQYNGEFRLQHFSIYHDTITGYVVNSIVEEAHRGLCGDRGR